MAVSSRLMQIRDRFNSRRNVARLARTVRESRPWASEALESRLLFAGLPTGFQEADIGTVGTAGSSSFTSGTFNVQGAGTDLFGSADAFHYVYTTLTGNGTFVAHVSSITAADTGAPAGIDLRSTLDPAAANIFIAATPSGNVVVNDRLSDGGQGTNRSNGPQAAPYFLKLIRTGATVSSYISSNGTNYVLLATDTFQNLGATVDVGLAVVSHNPNALATGVFDQVQTTTFGAIPNGFTEGDVGAVGSPGFTDFNSGTGTFSVSGAGDDLFGAADAFHYVYQTLNGDGSFIVHETAASANAINAPAGIDLRSSLAPTAANLFVGVRPDTVLIVNDRTSDGGTGTNLAASQGALPVWLKVTRAGNVITAFTSPDNVTYTQVASDTLPNLGTSVFVGMAVASHNVNSFATGTFDNASLVGVGAPSASVTNAPTITQTPVAPYQFQVTYTDTAGINASTIGNGNLTVTGPGGYSQAATLVSTGLTNATSLPVTYSVPAPTVNGTYAITANANSVQNVNAVPLAAGTVGTFAVNIAGDGQPPTATLSSKPVVSSATQPYVFGVTYDDNVAVMASTLGNGNILVTGPNGYSHLATLVSTGLSNGPQIVAQYSIPAPAAAGTYTFTMQASQVTDTSGSPVATGSLGTVDSTFTPGAQLTTAPTVTVTQSTPYQFVVTYGGPNPIDTATLGSGDITVTGPGGYSQNGTFVSSAAGTGNQVAATYTVPAPTVNGTYTVALNANQVTDTSNNVVPAGAVGTFATNISTGATGSIAGSVINSLNNSGIVGRTIRLNTGATTTTNSTGNFTFANLAPGSYIVTETLPAGVVVTDPANDSRPVALSSGQTATGVTFANLPATTPGAADLIATLSGKIPSSVVSGASGIVKVKVTNIGTALATGPATVALLVSPTGTLSGANTVVTTVSTGTLKLKQNASKTVSIKFNYPSGLASGSYRLVGVANSTDAIAESNFTNNSSVSGAVTIAPAFVSLSGKIVKFPTSLARGKTGHVTVQIINAGNVASSGTLSVALVESPTPTAAGGVPLVTLGKGAKIKPSGGKLNFTINFKAPANVTLGSQFIVAIINGNNANIAATPSLVTFS